MAYNTPVTPKQIQQFLISKKYLSEGMDTGEWDARTAFAWASYVRQNTQTPLSTQLLHQPAVQGAIPQNILDEMLNTGTPGPKPLPELQPEPELKPEPEPEPEPRSIDD